MQQLPYAIRPRVAHPTVGSLTQHLNSFLAAPESQNQSTLHKQTLSSSFGFFHIRRSADRMEDGTAGFDDWEMLQPESAEEAEVETEGLMMLRLDHFSVSDSKMIMKYSGSGDDERSEISHGGGGGSVESDNPSWIDPAAFPRRNSGEFWPDSASDRSKLSDSEEKLGLGFMENDRSHVFELESQGTYLGKLEYGASGSSLGVENEAAHEVEKVSVVSENSMEKMDIVENQVQEFGNRTEMEVVEDGGIEKEVEQPFHVEKKALLWWKLPLELVKFCVFRISPVWSISVAAAAMLGVFIIRRRLHMMKRKTKGLQMKVTIDDKKVDQFTSRAARLNEAFSVVRRVPIIRPSLPAPIGTLWPVVSMR